MKETFLIKIHGRNLGGCRFFIRINEDEEVVTTIFYKEAQKFVDYPSAELYLKSNREAFKPYFACSIEKYFIV